MVYSQALGITYGMGSLSDEDSLAELMKRLVHRFTAARKNYSESPFERACEITESTDRSALIDAITRNGSAAGEGSSIPEYQGRRKPGNEDEPVRGTGGDAQSYTEEQVQGVHSALGLVVSRETQNLGVPYYVDKGFEKEYQGASLRDLESTIETDYIDYLQTSCWKDKQQKTDLANLGRLYRDERLKQKADSMKLENCEKLNRLIGRQRGE
ncbi:UNVERIFIED_CONTAM: hypothetical protein FKN15_044727 [Acipenser sinensis]